MSSIFQLPTEAESRIGNYVSSALLLDAARHSFYFDPKDDGTTWHSPATRWVVDVATAKPNKSTRQSVRDFHVSVNQAFRKVIEGCASVPRWGENWVSEGYADALLQLHQRGLAHSIETWRDGVLVGGTFGFVNGRILHTESAFRTVDNAAKAAAVACNLLARGAFDLVDDQDYAQWKVAYGCAEVTQAAYIERLVALRHAQPGPFPARAPFPLKDIL